MSVLVGAVVQVYGKFKDKHGVLIDPTNVQVKVRRPNNIETTYVYGVDVQLVRESMGVYYINIDTTGQTGTWYARWNSTGTGQGVGQTNFTVVATQI